MIFILYWHRSSALFLLRRLLTMPIPAPSGTLAELDNSTLESPANLSSFMRVSRSLFVKPMVPNKPVLICTLELLPPSDLAPARCLPQFQSGSAYNSHQVCSRSFAK